MAEKITAILIIEVLGKPAEYIKKALEDILIKLKNEKDVRVTHGEVKEPKELESGIFTTFAEIELETNIQMLMNLLFLYMPSHIEIIQPENLNLKNCDLNSFLNEITRKLHQYDELAKAMLMEKEVAKQPPVADFVPVPVKKKIKKKK
ncbi:MAG: hypothetical protein NT076_00710 [Candidatus Pacearchaeota archaeon]|nr:hypothetical protein [Candidatus Pacearchaeota archaeon]